MGTKSVLLQLIFACNSVLLNLLDANATPPRDWIVFNDIEIGFVSLMILKFEEYQNP